MHVRAAIGAICLLAIAGAAVGQSQHLVFTQDDFEPTGSTIGQGIIATAPSVGVGVDAVAVTANRRVALYTRTQSLLDIRDVGVISSVFPFIQGTLPDPLFPLRFPILFDPRADHDPIANRLWMLYAEGTGTNMSTQSCGTIARLHLAVNRDPSDFSPPGGPLNTLNDTHWWYYTGDGSVPTKAGPKYDLTAPLFTPYRGETGHSEPTITVRLPTMAFDEQAIIVAPSSLEVACTDSNSLAGDAGYEQYLFIIPRTHDSGTLSILDGDRPAENDITIIRMASAPPIGSDRIQDKSDFFYAVQEPFPNLPAPAAPDQVENATFFVNVIDRAAEIQTDIRVRGLYDADPGPGVDWTLQQQTSSLPAPINLVDMALPASLHFTNPTKSLLNPLPLLPRTPDMSTPYAWRPNAVGAIFHSAVLARDTNGDHRIFAIHAVQPAERDLEGEVTTTDQWVVQWYVIDPKLSDFGTGTIGQWQPNIVASGRLPGEGDRYHPVIVLNRQGQAFIEYTYSDDSTYPQIRRVRLNSSYTATVANTDLPVRSGPMLPYAPGDPSTLGEELNYDDFWADYADAQADPFNGCAYWSTHTLVHDDSVSNPSNKRDIWLFHQAYSNSVGPNCFQTPAMLDLTDDNEVDAYDLAEFSHLYDRRARRVDINGDGVVDAIDMALYLDAYNAYTSK